MGGINSCCVSRRNCCCGISSANSAPKVKGHRRNLSATFNMSIVEEANNTSSLVGINTATEEELMTVPGINRAIAKNIIDYRNHIGGFRSIEDVALVSGVGAERLAVIRSDIFVTPATLDEASYENLRSPSSVISPTENFEESLMINVNTANIFTLIKVNGIGLTTAKNIVAYRDRNGPFKNLDDLVKVRGIGQLTLESMRPYIRLDDSKSPKYSLTNGKRKEEDKRTYDTVESNDNYKRASTASIEDLLQLLGPLGKVPERPEVEKVTLKHKNRRVFRLASWNLERFSVEKARHPGVKDVVCMTILENCLGIVAVQELADKLALDEICQELNSPTLPNVKRWKGRRGQWACVVSEAAGRMFRSTEYMGFLFDRSQNIEHVHHFLIEKAPNQERSFTRKPFLAIFKINDMFDCIVVNLHLKATGLSNEDKSKTENEVDSVANIREAIKKEVKDEEDIVILGDFNLSPDAPAFKDLRGEGYINCIPSNTFTNISNSNRAGSKSYDNIWINKETQKVYTGVASVVRDGLFSPWIPDEWTWGGVVSDHCPAFAQLYTNTDLDNGDLSSRSMNVVMGREN